jgi:hypothetical protein
MKYKVKYIDYTGINDEVLEFDTEEEAERTIKDDLIYCTIVFKDCDYDYADFGNKTEFWISGSNVYVSWERMYR